MRASSVGAPPTRSDMPVPRLSKRISRANDPTRSMNAARPGIAVSISTWLTNPGTKTMSNGPSPLT
jgi:hypothetical protein